MESTKQIPHWFRLDNAAKIFPSIINKRTTTVYRISASITRSVDSEILQRALIKTLNRFPYYRVSLRWGFFWHYLQYNPQDPLVQKENGAPCRKISPDDNNGYLFRIFYYEKRISLECSHIITDGTGAVTFLRSLLCQYFIETGITIKNRDDIFNIEKPPHVEEFEDAYRKFYKKDIPAPSKKEKAFHIIEKLIDADDQNIITGIIDVKELLKIARNYGVTITELLSSVYLHSLYLYAQDLPWKIKKKELKPIRLMVPVNLRKIYKSKTMRNFFLTVSPGIDPRLGHYNFEDVIKEVYHYMRLEVDERFINQQINRNVNGEIHPLVRLVPLPLKVLVERLLYGFVATSRQSGVLTNMGAVSMPSEIEKHIERFDCIANPNEDTKINCGVISYHDKIHITFGSLVDSTIVQMYFFQTLRKMDLAIKIETN